MADDLSKIRYKYTASGTSVTISAKSGESHRIKEIFIDSPANNSWMDVVIGTRTVARIPVKLQDSLFIAPYNGSWRNYSICQYIRDVFGADVFFEADEDEDITLQFSSSQTGIHVFYEVDKPGIDKTKLGRSESEDYILFSIVTHSSDITASGNYSLNTAKVPRGFPEIIDGFVVPSGREVELRGLAFGAAASGSSIPTYFHIYDETYEFFDPINHTGIRVDPNHNVLIADVKTLDFYLVEPYVFESGHKILLSIDAEHDGTNNIAAETEYAVLIGLWRLKK